MWGIIPAAGSGTRIQPLAFSKELLPVGSRFDNGGVERPRAVSEYLVERMIRGGATRICFVIAPGKSDILSYYADGFGAASIVFAVQPRPLGLCDAIFRALPVLADDDHVLIGLPDTIWFPEDALASLPDGELSFLTFPVSRPELFDAIDSDAEGQVRRVEVKTARPTSRFVWGAIKMPAATLRALHALWNARERQDEYIGTLVNAWLHDGNRARAVPAGESYVDVGTLGGWREALYLLDRRRAGAA